MSVSSYRSGRDLVKRNGFGAAPRLPARVLLGSLVLAGSVLRVTRAAPLFPGEKFEAGTAPTSVAMGDFNGDGRPDLAVLNRVSQDVSVLLGNGDGTFGAQTRFAAGSYPYSVAVGDFNGDGRPDLAVANYLSNDVSVLLGKGDGT